jgi:putative ABC transport system ATP-binding protein
MSLIDARGLTKVYKLGRVEVPALRGVDVTVEAGEYVAIMGPSGSGKSTLMHILGCLDSPTAGTFTLDGEDVSRLSGRALARVRNRKVGFVFQTFNLMPRLTVEENVALPLKYRGGLSRRERRDRARALLTRLGLEHRIGHRPEELSGGERQRVAVARALVGEPAILMADEPTGNLDSKAGGEVLKTLRELHALGNTIVMITHDSHVAEEAERTVHLADGRIANGTAASTSEAAASTSGAPSTGNDGPA